MNDLKINIPSAPVMPAAAPVMPAANTAPVMPAAITTPVMPAAAPTPTIPTPAAAAPVAVPTLDLDALLSKIQETKPTTAGNTRKATALVTSIAEGIKSLVEKATTAEIDRLPFSTVIRQTAIALGVVDKKSQYYYTLGQSVLKLLEGTLKIYKEGRKTFIACAGDIIIEPDTLTDPEIPAVETPVVETPAVETSPVPPAPPLV